MKQSLFILTLFLGFGLISCSSDNDDWDDSFVSDATKAAQLKLYPEARSIKWGQKGDYLIAEFYLHKKEVEAWYDNIGNWYMTETDWTFNELPLAVKTAFEQTAYALWKIDEVDKLERQNRELLYIIEVEKGKKEIKLYYTADGVLVSKSVDVDHSDNHSPLLPTTIPSEIQQHLDAHHKHARIVHVGYEQRGFWKVKLVEDFSKKEVLFKDEPISWLLTKWEIRELPQVVLAGIDKTEYSKANGWKIDDVEQIDTASGTFYEVEFEKGEQEVELIFNTLGELADLDFYQEVK